MNSKPTVISNFIKRIALISLGAFLSAVVINGLYLPNHLLSGGIAGIAMLLNLTLSWDTALVTFLINIPIFIAGFILMDKKFVLYSMVGMIALSLSLKITDSIPVISENIIVVMVLGGALYGFSIALVALQHGSCGGNDIITRILHRYFAVPLGTSTFLINLSILGASVYFFGIDITIMTLIANFVYSTSLNYFSEKRFSVKMLLVRSEKTAQIKQSLSGYRQVELVSFSSTEEEQALIALLRPKDLHKIRTEIEEIDGGAMVSTVSAESVKGRALQTKQFS